MGSFLTGIFFVQMAWAVTGQVCINSIPVPNDEKRELGNSAGGRRVSDFSVQIDNGEIKNLSHKNSVLYGGLELEKKHWVRIRNQGKQIESFSFSFLEVDSDSLCLWFNALYETWSLWPQSRSYHLCDCRN